MSLLQAEVFIEQTLIAKEISRREGQGYEVSLFFFLCVTCNETFRFPAEWLACQSHGGRLRGKGVRPYLTLRGLWLTLRKGNVINGKFLNGKKKPKATQGDRKITSRTIIPRTITVNYPRTIIPWTITP